MESWLYKLIQHIKLLYGSSSLHNKGLLFTYQYNLQEETFVIAISYVNN